MDKNTNTTSNKILIQHSNYGIVDFPPPPPMIYYLEIPTQNQWNFFLQKRVIKMIYVPTYYVVLIYILIVRSY